MFRAITDAAGNVGFDNAVQRGITGGEYPFRFTKCGEQTPEAFTAKTGYQAEPYPSGMIVLKRHVEKASAACQSGCPHGIQRMNRAAGLHHQRVRKLVERTENKQQT